MAPEPSDQVSFEGDALEGTAFEETEPNLPGGAISGGPIFEEAWANFAGNFAPEAWANFASSGGPIFEEAWANFAGGAISGGAILGGGAIFEDANLPEVGAIFGGAISDDAIFGVPDGLASEDDALALAFEENTALAGCFMSEAFVTGVNVEGALEEPIPVCFDPDGATFDFGAAPSFEDGRENCADSFGGESSSSC